VKTSQLANKKWFLGVVMGMAFLWMFVTSRGGKLPYIITENSLNIRAYLVFPLFMLFLIWFGFLHKWQETTSTGYQMMMVGIKGKKERLKQAILLILGFGFLAGGVAWQSNYTMAFVANLAANKPYVETYKVYDSKGVSNLTELELQNLSNKETAYIRLKYDAFGKGIWDSGAIVKIEGRTSIFGTIAEKATLLEQ
jgi:hypothetical protein